MTIQPRPAVERRHPPKAPFVAVNAIMRWLLSAPRRASRVGRHLMLLQVTGRVSGRRMTFPVAYRRLGDGRLLVLTSAGWRRNLRDRPDVAVTLLGVRRAARAQLVEEPAAVAEVYRTLIDQVGPAHAGRRMGIRINVPRTPTTAELADAARRDGLSVVYLTVASGSVP